MGAFVFVRYHVRTKNQFNQRMPQLFIKKQFETLGAARDFVLSVAQQMNQGHTRGAGWSLAEKGDKKDDAEAPVNAPQPTGEGSASTTGEQTQPPTPPEPGPQNAPDQQSEGSMPWNKGKK